MSVGLSHVLGLGLAAALGGAVGLEREMHGQPAGLRTHMVLSIGAALATELSILFSEVLSPAGNPSDPARLAAQVISGVGFLGAGAIVRYGANIKGLTTAASLWTTAIVGVACGSGFGQLAGTAAVMVVATLRVVRKIERRLFSSYHSHSLELSLEDRPGVVRDLHAELMGLGIRVVSTSVSVAGPTALSVSMVVRKPDGLTFDKLIGAMRTRVGAQRIRIE